MKYKSGYVAILGRANAGKSSLVNALIGAKVAIVSPKPQTTRNNILGILTKQNYQLILVDTPGIHKTKNALDKYMMKNVRSAIGGAEVFVYLIDATKKISEEEVEYLKTLAKKGENLIVCLTKIDLLRYENVLPLIEKISKIEGVLEIIPISSFKNKNLTELVDIILKYIPETEEKNFYYEEDSYTDKSLRFMASEIIREKALYFLQEEIPHGITAIITNFSENKKITLIECDIVCERDSHKSIIIGKGGTMLKKIGESARKDIEDLLNNKVMLKLFVKTKKNWRDNLNRLTDFGYRADD